jgi:hypothetical protein
MQEKKCRRQAAMRVLRGWGFCGTSKEIHTHLCRGFPARPAHRRGTAAGRHAWRGCRRCRPRRPPPPPPPAAPPGPARLQVESNRACWVGGISRRSGDAVRCCSRLRLGATLRCRQQQSSRTAGKYSLLESLPTRHAQQHRHTHNRPATHPPTHLPRRVPAGAARPAAGLRRPGRPLL